MNRAAAETVRPTVGSNQERSMKIAVAALTGLVAFAPVEARAAAACVGKVQVVCVETDMNVYFNVAPTRECGCNNVPPLFRK